MKKAININSIHRGSFYFDILQSARRKKVLTRKSLSKRVATVYNISPSLIEERRSGGNVLESHLSWDIHALKDRGFVNLTKRGSYKITAAGRDFVEQWRDNDGAFRRRNRGVVNATVASLKWEQGIS